jgi:hypothetical protein
VPMKLDLSWQSVFHSAVIGVALGVLFSLPRFGPAWGFKEIAISLAAGFVIIRSARWFITGRPMFD